MKHITRTGNVYHQREAATFMKQSNYSEKVFVVERLRSTRTDGNISKDLSGRIEYRIGYYIVGKIRKAEGKWVWGQFCPMIPKEDFSKLIEKAKKEGTIID